MDMKDIINFLNTFEKTGMTELRLGNGNFVLEVKQDPRVTQKLSTATLFHEIKVEPPKKSPVDPQTGFSEEELFHSSGG